MKWIWLVLFLGSIVAGVMWLRSATQTAAVETKTPSPPPAELGTKPQPPVEEATPPRNDLPSGGPLSGEIVPKPPSTAPPPPPPAVYPGVTPIPPGQDMNGAPTPQYEPPPFEPPPPPPQDFQDPENFGGAENIPPYEPPPPPEDFNPDY